MDPRMPDDYTLPLLRVRVGDLPDRALVVGDPGRVAKVAARLSDVRELGANREYVTVVGRYRGREIVVASHGVGSAGAAVCFEELCRGGVGRIIRAGTAGGLQDDVGDGDVVVAAGAVRDDGVSPKLVPLGYPAVTDAALTLALQRAVSDGEMRSHVGIVVTSDVFYPVPATEATLPRWQRAGCVAVEMELATLLVIAAQHRVAAAGIVAIDGNPLRSSDDDMSGYQPFREVVDRAVEAAIDAALDALVSEAG